MQKTFFEMLQGYKTFREKYVEGDHSIMEHLAYYGQKPEMMMVACCDSRVDPALILQCNPGDLFVVRNVANIIPPYEKDIGHHGTSAALEFGVCYLQVKDLIILGHSQCGGISALLNNKNLHQNDFITSWVSLIESPETALLKDADSCAKSALLASRNHCLSFPWIKEKVEAQQLNIHLWFFDIQTGQIFSYVDAEHHFQPLG